MLGTLQTSATLTVALTLSIGTASAQTPRPERSESSLQQRITELEKRVERLETEVRILSVRIPYRTATLDCDNGRYAEFLPESSSIVLFASCAKIEPYLEGHQVTLNIGNPSTFNLNNISGNLYYGKDIVDAFSRSVPVSTTESLRFGVWTRIVVTVNPSKAEDMRHLELSIKSTSVGPGR